MMSYPSQTPHMYPYIPPPYIHPPMGLPMNTAAPVIIAKPPLSVPAPAVENNQRFSAFERPITTVFIGNISEKITDALMKEVLAKCGNVLSWKRVQGASGKLQAFGFCEYDNPEATLRCIRLLNDFAISDKSLVVKVDPKTDELLTDYKNKKQKAIEDREAEDVTRTEDEKKERINLIYAREVDEDKNALIQIKKIIKDSGSEPSCETDKKEKKVDKHDTLKNLNLEEGDLDGDKKNLISREIEMFRNKHKDDDTNDGKEERYKRIRERDLEKRRERGRERSKDRHRRHRTRSRSKTSRQPPDEERQRKISRPDSRSSSIVSKKRRSGSKDTHKSSKRSKRDSDKELDEYEVAMFKKMEKKLRDKEAAYQKRLQAWEGREKKKIKEYEIERDRGSAKENEIAEEARKLQIFFEDYDDEKWDAKYYRGTELERRLMSRRMEEQTDEKDRSKELEQIESTRQRLMKEQNPNVEAIILRMEQSMQEHLQKRLKLDFDSMPVVVDEDKIGGGIVSQDGHMIIGSVANALDNNLVVGSNIVTDNSTIAATTTNDNYDHEQSFSDDMVDHVNNYNNLSNDYNTTNENAVHKLLNDSFKPMVVMSTSSATTASQIADNASNNNINNEDSKSAPITSSNNIIEHTNANQGSSNLSSTERKAMVKKIIDGIPTIKADLFAYPIEWDMIDESFVDTRIKPWVDKKIVAYIGEEEPSLSKFICDQVLDHKTPDQILADIAMVLEEEADVFVMKMWRLLIYVIEEKKAGLDK